jgi:hypothetical protein
MRKKHKAAMYIECSTLTGEGCEEVLKAAIRVLFECERELRVEKKKVVQDWFRSFWR